MHTCSNDLGLEWRIYLYSIVLSIFSFFLLLMPFYDFLKTYFNFAIPIWVETPSIIGLYGLFNRIFEKIIWKHKIVSWFGLPKIPNLNGKWNATMKSSYGGTKDAEVTISQSFSKLTVVLKTDQSVSTTKMAAFQLQNPVHQTLTYTYLSKPISTAPTTMSIHEGTGCIEILNSKELKGEYYSGRGRQIFGEISLTKN